MESAVSNSHAAYYIIFAGLAQAVKTAAAAKRLWPSFVFFYLFYSLASEAVDILGPNALVHDFDRARSGDELSEAIEYAASSRVIFF